MTGPSVGQMGSQRQSMSRSSRGCSHFTTPVVTRSWLNFMQTHHRLGKLDVESSRSRASAGSTCLSVSKVPPEHGEYIPPTLGGHAVTASRGDSFFLRGKQVSVQEGERTLHHETTTQKRTWPRTKPSVVQLQSGVYKRYNACRISIKGRKHLVSCSLS